MTDIFDKKEIIDDLSKMTFDEVGDLNDGLDYYIYNVIYETEKETGDWPSDECLYNELDKTKTSEYPEYLDNIINEIEKLNIWDKLNFTD
jgi:hypothetical protein